MPARQGQGGPQRRRTVPARQPAKRGIPPVVWVVLLGLPLLGIVTLLGFRKPEEEAGKVETVRADPNQRLSQLKLEIGSIREAYKQFITLSRAEDPAAKAKQEALVERIDRWMGDWDAILNAHRDAAGGLPPELRGYQDYRTQVSQILIDLLKSSSF